MSQKSILAFRDKQTNEEEKVDENLKNKKNAQK